MEKRYKMSWRDKFELREGSVIKSLSQLKVGDIVSWEEMASEFP